MTRKIPACSSWAYVTPLSRSNSVRAISSHGAYAAWCATFIGSHSQYRTRIFTAPLAGGRRAAATAGSTCRWACPFMSSSLQSPSMAPTQTAADAAITVRLLKPSDSITEITRLLHRAYAKQVAMGLQPLAGRQDDSITAERAGNSECFVAVAAVAGREHVVGIILFEEQEKATFPPFFLRPDVCHFAQFGVDPDMQGRGIGRQLLQTVERRAREKGATELALSMAEPDRELYDWYINRGYRLIEYWQWPYTNYRSCILSKALAGRDGQKARSQ